MFIVSVTAFVFLIGVIYLVRATPLYTATTQVLLEQREKLQLQRIAVDRLLPHRRLFVHAKTSLQSCRSDSLLRRVVIKERLAVPPPSAKESQSADVPKEDPTSAEDQSILNGINRLRGALAVSRSGQAQVLNISITWEDPTRAAQLANAVADAYVVDQLDARS